MMYSIVKMLEAAAVALQSPKPADSPYIVSASKNWAFSILLSSVLISATERPEMS